MIVLAISGRLRAASVNSALLRATARLAPSEIDVRVYSDICALPLFNPDLESKVPSEVTSLREKIRAADAVIFASPEVKQSREFQGACPASATLLTAQTII